jgi:hypothetical protein
MWDHGAPALFRWLLAAYAGYTVMRALFRWVCRRLSKSAVIRR